MNCQGKPGIVREFSMFFIHVREKSYLVSISISLTIGMVVREVVILIVVSKCELYNLLREVTSIMSITYRLGSIFFTSVCKYVK